MDTYDLQIYKGSTYSLSITLRDSDSVPIDLTNYDVSGLLKFRYSNSEYLTSLNVTKSLPYTSGVITLSIPATGTSILPVGYGFYDIETYLSGTVDKVLLGKALIYPESTW